MCMSDKDNTSLSCIKTPETTLISRMTEPESMSVSPISFPSGKGPYSHTLPCGDKTGKYDTAKYLPRVSTSKNTSHDSTGVSHDRQVTDDSMDLSSAKHLQRSLKTVKRKDVARRQLMCTMYSKHNSVKRSFSFVAGERPTDVRFPSVNYHEDDTKWARERPDRKHRIGSKYTTTSSDIKHMTYVNSQSEHSHSGISNRTRTENSKVNLPEIIMDFNYESGQSGRRTMMTSLSDSDDEERAIGAPYEEYLKNTKLLANNPYKSRHRPVTPGLLESLNKLRLPSKTKTEQWLKGVSNTRKSYCDDNYKVGNLMNSNLAIPNWIYTDT